jgi:hypothetical protein
MLNRLFDVLRGRGAAVPAPTPPAHPGTIPLDQVREMIAQGHTPQACLLLHDLANIRPRDADVLSLYGWALFDLASYDQARDVLAAALTIQPGHPEALNTMGALAATATDPEDAIAWFEDALEVDPGSLVARYNLAQALFVGGHYRRGFDLLRARHQLLFGKENLLEPIPAWQGESLAGKHVFVWCDWGGLGDHLQFVRYVAMLRERANPAHLTLGVGREFITLFARLPGVDTVALPGRAAPEADVHCPLLDLPHLFDTDLDTVPISQPYISADPTLAAQWNTRLQAGGLAASGGSAGPLRVGLAWKSVGAAGEVRVYQRMRVSKSVPPGLLAGLAGPHADFVSLQVGADAQEVAATGLAPLDYTGEWRDFDATAAVIANLDLVVSADTSVAHLAAAMGKPVLLLLRRESGLFWLQDRADSPWYPTMRILRQSDSGAWEPVVAAAAQWLRRAAVEGPDVILPNNSNPHRDHQHA